MRQAVTVERWIDDSSETTDVLEALMACHWETLGRGELSTEHAASSQGFPVLVIDGQAYGCADLPEGAALRPQWTELARGTGHLRLTAAEQAEAERQAEWIRLAQAAGYRVEQGEYAGDN